MKPVDLVRKLRREAAVKPATLDRGKAVLMAAIRQEVQPMRRPTIVPRLPYEDVGAALSFLERAFGFREVSAARGVRADGAIDHTMVEFGDGMIGLGAQGAHGAFSPKRAGTATQYITVHVDDIDAHHQRALASGAEIVSRLHDHLRDYRVYEALDLEGHRWRFPSGCARCRSPSGAEGPVKSGDVPVSGEPQGPAGRDRGGLAGSRRLEQRWHSAQEEQPEPPGRPIAAASGPPGPAPASGHS